jgi:peptidoglycan/xylan/chitin deacetylase (PgdA/CDA1 family)
MMWVKGARGRRGAAAAFGIACGLVASVAASASGPVPVPGPRTGTEPSRRVAVTVDDLPANMFAGDLSAWESMTRDLVDGLVRHGVPAIGFVNESKLYDGGEIPDPARVALLQAWIDAGLELGNHTYAHPDLHSTPLAEFQADLLQGEVVTRQLLAEIGDRPRYFRHPYLHTGTDLATRDALHAFLAEHGYTVAPVTIDNQEWIAARAYDHALVRGDSELAERIAATYVEYMNDVFGYYEQQSTALLGYELPQVLLIHANRLNARVIDELVASIRDRGYEFVSLSEALEDPAYGSPDEFTGTGGITWLHRWALTAGHRGEFFAGEPELPSFVHEAYGDRPR